MHPSPNPHLYTLDEPLDRAAVLAELAALPARLRDTIAAIAPQRLTRAPDGEWSAFQTLCHVRDAALVYSARFRFIILNHDPLLPNYDEENWVAAARDTLEDVPAILAEIAASRADLIRVLSRIDEASWRRTGRHEVAGSLVLEDYVRHQLAHERQHLAQLRNHPQPSAPAE